jgi:hypothetical protein
MPRMQIVQQRQPIPPCKKVKGPLKIAAIVLVQAVAIVASLIFSSGIFGIAAAMALSLGVAIDLKKKGIILAVATAFTALVAAVSLAALFPVAAPFMVPVVCFATTFTFLWGLKEELAVLPKSKKIN